MGDKKHAEHASAATGVVVSKSSGGISSFTHHLKRNLALLVVAVVIIVVGVLVIHHQQQVRAAAKEKASLQKIINSAATYSGSPDKLLAASATFIDDTQTGKFSATNNELAQAYVARADAESNLRQYKTASNDYAQAIKLDGSVQQNILYPEFYARYKAGERQTLIPLLKQLIQQEQAAKTDDFAGANIAQYQGYINSIQQGQEIDL